jgi:GDP-L-fucose synthase
MVRNDLERANIQGLDTGSNNQQIMDKLHTLGFEFKQQEVNLSLWGSGNVYREFLHVDDMAQASVFLMQNLEASHLYSDLMKTHINIGTGVDLTIKELAEIIQAVVGFKGEILWDTSKPDGTPKKQLDVSLLKLLGWEPSISLQQGINEVYKEYINQ